MPRIPHECMAGAGFPPPDGTVGKAGAGAPLRDPSPRCSASVSAESVRQMEKREQDLLEEQPPRGRCA